MEYKAIKCTSCGASLNTKPDEEGNVTCKYCHTTFHVETDYDQAYDRTKGALDAQRDHLNEMGFGTSFNKSRKIFFIVFFCIVATMIIGTAITMFVSIGGFGLAANKMDKSTFNDQFENRVGTNTYGTICWLIDDVVTNNKTKDRAVEFCLKDDCTKVANDIVLYKDKLNKFGEYEVILDYDNDGYVTRVNVIPRSN